MTRGCSAVMALVCVLFGAACGVPSDDQFRGAKPPDALARPPVAPTTTSAPTTTLAVASTLPPISATTVPSLKVQLYFVRNGALVAMDRSFPESVTPQGILNTLLFGPPNGDPTLRTVADLSSVVTVQSPIKGVATVVLSEGFIALPGSEQRLAIGQIVLTMTGLRGVGQVQFSRAGFPQLVPLPDGQSAVQVAREDVAALLESAPGEGVPALTTPTTTTTTTTTVAPTSTPTTTRRAVRRTSRTKTH